MTILRNRYGRVIHERLARIKGLPRKRLFVDPYIATMCHPKTPSLSAPQNALNAKLLNPKPQTLNPKPSHAHDALWTWRSGVDIGSARDGSQGRTTVVSTKS